MTARRLLGAGVLLVLAAAAALWFVPSDDYIFLPDTAKQVAPLVHVAGGKEPRGPGGIYLVDVLVRRANLAERLVPGLHDGSTLVPRSAFDAPGQSDKERQQADLQAMTRSQDIGAAVALRALGYDVRAVPTGVLVAGIVDGTPAVGKLEPGDVLTAVDGKPVRTPTALRRVMRRKSPGDRVVLAVRGGTGLRAVALRLAAEPKHPKRPFIGVLVDQAARIRLPVKVEIDTGEIGGPSAGLAFALDVMEELGRDVDRGRKVGATGELALDGQVLPVGGLKQKTIGARNSGLDVLLVPAGANAREAKRYADGMRVIPVRTFRQALRALATLPRAA